MQKKNFCLTALTASAVLVGAHAASAQDALYDFSEFTTDSSNWPANNGPYANSGSSTLGTASELENIGMSILEAANERVTGEALDGWAALIGPGSMPAGDGGEVPTPTADDDYFGFTFSTSAPTEFETFSFDYGVSATEGAAANFPHSTAAQLFYSVDGVTFAPVGDLQEREIPEGGSGFTGMETSVIDLSGLDEVLPGETVEFRLAVRNNRGFGSDNGAIYFDNIALTAIPEPTSAALLGLAGAGLLIRRRRA